MSNFKIQRFDVSFGGLRRCTGFSPLTHVICDFSADACIQSFFLNGVFSLIVVEGENFLKPSWVLLDVILCDDRIILTPETQVFLCGGCMPIFITSVDILEVDYNKEQLLNLSESAIWIDGKNSVPYAYVPFLTKVETSWTTLVRSWLLRLNFYLTSEVAQASVREIEKGRTRDVILDVLSYPDTLLSSLNSILKEET